MRKKSYIIKGSLGRRIAVDVLETADAPKATLIYLHGFGGFKDWGDNDYLAGQWLGAGLRYIRFNFSLNGTTPEYPTEFVDLDGFASNNYSHMVFDIGMLISFVRSSEFELHHPGVGVVPLILAGHSMGGTVALLTACELAAVDAAISWAAPATCKTPWERWNTAQMQQWEQNGVQYYLNSRTRQKIPLYYQLYQDFEANVNRFDLKSKLAAVNKPLLMVHGSQDVSVPPASMELLASWAPGTQACLVPGDHTFDRKHPATGYGTTTAMEAVMEVSLSFVRSLFHN